MKYQNAVYVSHGGGVGRGWREKLRTQKEIGKDKKGVRKTETDERRETEREKKEGVNEETNQRDGNRQTEKKNLVRAYPYCLQRCSNPSIGQSNNVLPT